VATWWSIAHLWRAWRSSACETDVVNTYRVWLRYELFRGRLTDAEFQASEGNLVEFIKAHGNTKPHLSDLM
jgi:hypothetical protein